MDVPWTPPCAQDERRCSGEHREQSDGFRGEYQAGPGVGRDRRGWSGHGSAALREGDDQTTRRRHARADRRPTFSPRSTWRRGCVDVQLGPSAFGPRRRRGGDADVRAGGLQTRRRRRGWGRCHRRRTGNPSAPDSAPRRRAERRRSGGAPSRDVLGHRRVVRRDDGERAPGPGGVAGGARRRVAGIRKRRRGGGCGSRRGSWRRACRGRKGRSRRLGGRSNRRLRGRRRGRRRRAGRRSTRRRRSGRRRARGGSGLRRRCGRVARGRGRARGGRRRCRSGRRRRRRTRGQERLRIEVSLVLGCDSHAEVDVRLGVLALAPCTDASDGIPFLDRRVLRDVDRAEMRERDRVAVRGGDRHRPARAGDAAGERDGPAAGGEHGLARGAGDVDAAVLGRRIRMRRVEGEVLQDGPARRPGPGSRCGRPDQRDGGGREEHAPHRHHLVVFIGNERLPG